MFADIRALESLRVGMPMLIFHAEPYVQCMSADGATPDSFLDCKSSWCSSHAWENHERCVLRAAPAARPHIAQHCSTRLTCSLAHTPGLGRVFQESCLDSAHAAKLEGVTSRWVATR